MKQNYNAALSAAHTCVRIVSPMSDFWFEGVLRSVFEVLSVALAALSA